MISKYTIRSIVCEAIVIMSSCMASCDHVIISFGWTNKWTTLGLTGLLRRQQWKWVHQHFDTGHGMGPRYILTESFDGWLRNPFSKLPTSNTQLTRTALMSVCWTTAFLDSWLGSTSSRRLTSCLASVSFSLASTSQWAAASSDLLLALAGLPSWERPIQSRVPVSPCSRDKISQFFFIGAFLRH